jgi:hypothetical protein
MATAATASAVREAVESLAIEYKSWESDPQDFLPEHLRGSISDGLAQSIERTIRAANDPAEDFEDKRIVLAIDRMAKEWRQWQSEYAKSPDQSGRHLRGHRGLWLAVEFVVDAMAHPFKFKHVETIEHLRRDKVPPRQIARIYEWFNDINEPDIDKVLEEFANKGTHVKGTYQLPSDLAQVAAIEADYKARVVLAEQRIVQQEQESQPVIAPEPLDDLICQRITCKQIQKMKQLPRDVILRRAGELGVMLPDEPNAASYSIERLDETVEREDREKQAEWQRQRREDLADTRQGEPLEDRIAGMYEQGIKPNEIAEILTAQYPDMTTQRVMAIIEAAMGE